MAFNMVKIFYLSLFLFLTLTPFSFPTCLKLSHLIVVVFMKYGLFYKSKFSEPQFNFLIAYSFSRFLHHIRTDATSTDNFNGYDRGS